MARISAVGDIHIKEVGLASICMIGDCRDVTPVSTALAVQRQTSTFIGTEGAFPAFPIFSRPIPVLEREPLDHFSIVNRDPYIRVRAVDIISISSSGVLQVGSNCAIVAVNRTKHIRQLQTRPRA